MVAPPWTVVVDPELPDPPVDFTLDWLLMMIENE